MKTLIACLLVISSFVSSCATYRKNFECPPSPGIPCASVTDIEQMIIETQRGPDIFGIVPGEALPPKSTCNRRIWIATECPDGYYIFLNQEVPCWIP